MPLGIGFWYDRRSRRYHLITEHATDAVEHPRRFRSQAVAHLNPVRDRDAVVRFVAVQEFIRIRHYKDRLGWQFHDQPDAALAVLRRFIRRHEIGILTLVTFTDFAAGWSVTVSAATIMTARSAAKVREGPKVAKVDTHELARPPTPDGR